MTLFEKKADRQCKVKVPEHDSDEAETQGLSG